jgi:hypothetical protein
MGGMLAKIKLVDNLKRQSFNLFLLQKRKWNSGKASDTQDMGGASIVLKL